jgi:ArsR family transcriptional regulator
MIHPDAMMTAAPKPELLLRWMECLADETRLRLLRLLEQHELGVAELCDVLQLPQSTVSRHLKVLSDQGWVHNRVQGTNHLYQTVLDEIDPPARKLWLLAREQVDGWATLRQDALRLDRRLRSREIDSQSFFAGAAGEWDKLRGELYGHGFARSALLTLLPREWVVADLGCGTGPLVAELAPFVRKVIGIDNSAAMLKSARKRASGLANVELRRGDLLSIPIETGSCDAALMLLTLTYIPDPAAAVREAARILRPGGCAVIVDLLPHDRDDFRRQMGQLRMGFEPKEIEQLLASADLAPSPVQALAPEPQAKGPALFIARGQRK